MKSCEGMDIYGISGAILVCAILIAFAAPMLSPNDSNVTNITMKNAEPSAEYPLGCEQMGRCELSRLLYGARYSLVTASLFFYAKSSSTVNGLPAQSFDKAVIFFKSDKQGVFGWGCCGIG